MGLPSLEELMVAELVTLKISGATYDAANIDMLWSWVSEGRVPDDSQIRLRGGDPFGRAPDVLSTLISADLDAFHRSVAKIVEPTPPPSLDFPNIARNAYRLLRVSGDATLAQLRAVEARVRRHQDLGRPTSATSDLRVLPPIDFNPRSVADAIARLEDPLKRVRERAWWFLQAGDLTRAKDGHTREFDDQHSTLLHAQLELAETDPSIQRADAWRAVLEPWRELFSSPTFSKTLLSLDAQGDFERRLKPVDAETIRGILDDEWPALFRWVVGRHISDQDHLSLVRALAVARDVGMPISHELRDSIGDELERLIAPAFQRAYTFLSRVNRTDRATPIINRLPIAAAERTLIEVIQPTINLFAAALSHDDLKVAEADDAATELLYAIGVASTWTDDFARAEQHLTSAAERTSPDSPLAENIAAMSERVQASRQRNAVFEGSKPPDNPTLFTFNGIGATFYGSSDFDATTNSYITTHYFVAIFVPLFALARYRVIQPESGKYQILAKYPITTGNKWHSAISAVVILSFILYASLTSSSGSSAQSGRSTSASIVNSGVKAQLSDLKQALERDRAEMERLDKLVDTETTQLEVINGELATLKTQIESIEADHSANRPVDGDEYDRLLTEYNQNVERYNALLATQKGHIEAYNTLLASDGKRVEDYNSLLRSAR